ncbi:MAG: alpha-galactosidase [Kiritimatiellae bacterium]|nr:alpha-galactosidase [Kiritimatiellia bacterium]
MHRLFFASALVALSAYGYETPTMGWSSWNTYRVNIDESLIKSQADAMVATGLKDCGYDHINIDDGWFGGRDENGRHTTNLKRFPNGLKPVVDYIHSKGLKAGAYSDAGENTCGWKWDNDELSYQVGFYDHDAADAKFFFTETGFDFIKVDFCGGLPYGNAKGEKMSERERYTAIRKAIDAEGFPNVRMNICRWAYPGTWASEAGFSWRVTPDIAEGWENVRNTLNEGLLLAPYAYGGHYNDLDMLEVGRGMTLEEDRTHFAMWCVLASPLLIGCDLTTIKPETLELLKNRELIAIDQDPLGLQAAIVRQYADDRYAFVKDLGKLGGTVRCLAFYSWSDEASEFEIAFDEVDLGGKVKVRELVEGVDLGTMEGKLSCKVPAHGTRVFRLEGEKRLERRRYPAHWAFLSGYQELDPDARTANYGLVKGNNGKYQYTARRVGGAEGDYLLWRDVLSEAGGEYVLKFDVFPCDGAGFDVEVNGENAGFASKACDFTLKARLKAGPNTIRLSNDAEKMCTICGVDLEPAAQQ